MTTELLYFFCGYIYPRDVGDFFFKMTMSEYWPYKSIGTGFLCTDVYHI